MLALSLLLWAIAGAVLCRVITDSADEIALFHTDDQED